MDQPLLKENRIQVVAAAQFRAQLRCHVTQAKADCRQTSVQIHRASQASRFHQEAKHPNQNLRNQILKCCAKIGEPSTEVETTESAAKKSRTSSATINAISL